MNAVVGVAHSAAQRRPLWLGVLLAPWSAPFALTAIAGLWSALDAGSSMGFAKALEVFAFAAAFGLPIAYAAMLLLGLPCALWLRQRGRLSTRALCVAAVPLGALALPVGLQVLGGHFALAAQVGAGALVGPVVALAFGLACGIPWKH